MKERNSLVTTRWVASPLLCGMLVFCIGTAFAQSHNDTASAPQYAANSADVNAAVSASATAMIRSDISAAERASASAPNSTSTLTSSSVIQLLEASHKAQLATSASSLMSGESFATHLKAGNISAGGLNGGLSSIKPPHRGHDLSALLTAPGMHRTLQSGDRLHHAGSKSKLGKPGTPGHTTPAGGGAGEVSASAGDFPDSTRGTAPMGLADLGTSSPLDWSPGLSFEIGGFGAEDFLNPTLHAAGHFVAENQHESLSEQRQNLRPGQTLRRRKKNQLNQTPPELSPDQMLEPDLLSTPVAQPDLLDQSRPATTLQDQINQELGVQ